ncbi:Fc.00g110880.m01.CDS01 [Cosmosporella sp. VM-42]
MAVSLLSVLSLIPIALVTYILISTMGLFGGNQLPVEGKTVLITGASEGMGLSAAKKLAAKGANIIIVARSVGKLEAAIVQIKAAAKNPNSQRFHYISADVSAPSYAGPVVAEAISWNHGKSPDIVWCIAGTSTPELFVESEMSSMRHQMDVNFYGTAEMSHTILREWLAPDAPIEDQPRHLIMTSSVVSFYTIPGYAPYAPSKFAIRGLADTISQEVMLYPQNVKVHIVYPGTILTAGYVQESKTKPEITLILEKDDPKQTPEDVAEKAIRGLERGEYSVTVAFLGQLMRWGVMGGMFRNNWIVDILGAWLVQLIWIFVQPDLHGKIRKYLRDHGHPSTWKKDRTA